MIDDELEAPHQPATDISSMPISSMPGHNSDIGARRAALSGTLAAGVALGTGELLSGLSTKIPSLVVAVGNAVIDNVPGSVERWAIETLGENDKPALVVGIVAISLIIGAFTGIAAVRQFRSAVSVFMLFGIVGGLAGAADEQSSTGPAWLAAAVAATVGLGALFLLLKAARSSTSTPASTTETWDGVARSGDSASRRAFVGAAGAATAIGIATPLIGSQLRDRQSAQIEIDRDQIAAALDRSQPTTSADEAAGATTPPSQASQPTAVMADYDYVDGIATLITPSDDFYRIDAALAVPRIDVDSWSMKITGMVDNELEFSFDDLISMDLVEEHITMSCVSNPVGGDLVGNAKWLGVPIKRLLDQAGVQPGGAQIVGRSVDGWTGAFPTSYLDDPNRAALVAVAMNDEPLPVQHGFPVRLVVAGLYGYVSATKWLKEIELVSADFDGYWITRGWSKLGPVKTQSRIDVPNSNARLSAGPHSIAGVAWAPDRGVDRVEVQVSPIVDGTEQEGEWFEAQLSEELTNESWRQWFLPWEAPAGDWTIKVRATDGQGVTQTSQISRPAPSGATGWHTIAVRVR